MHVPIGRNIRLTMGSEDVIHDYSIPAFRVKMDVVPGKLTTMWFNADQARVLTTSSARNTAAPSTPA